MKKAFVLAIAGAAFVLAPARAHAHFTMDSPPQWIEAQDTLGDPQKIAPCGVDSTVTYTTTNTVTTYAPGQTITLQWTETVAHDGWFRIALSYANRTDLTDPPYSANALGLSTDAGIENPPVPPVLVDGLYPHLAADITVPKAYTYALTLPQQPCAKCTLQIIQFMNNHPYNMPGGYFYHHCADIALVEGADGGSGAAASPDGGSTATGAGGSSGQPGGSTGSSASGGNGATTPAGGSNGSTGNAAGTDAGGNGLRGADLAGASRGCDLSGGTGSAAVGLAGLTLMGLLFGRRRRRS
jgi:MYXO-CTERM domain-containing protein